jgi:hypothetical protein
VGSGRARMVNSKRGLMGQGHFRALHRQADIMEKGRGEKRRAGDDEVEHYTDRVVGEQ